MKAYNHTIIFILIALHNYKKIKNHKYECNYKDNDRDGTEPC